MMDALRRAKGFISKRKSSHGRCTKFPITLCLMAMTGAPQYIYDKDTRCCECGSPLKPIEYHKKSTWILIFITSIIIVAGMVISYFSVFSGAGDGNTHASIQETAQEPVVTQKTTLVQKTAINEPKVSSSFETMVLDRDIQAETTQCTRLSSYLARLSGSNTVGGELAPDLAEAWLASKGASSIKRQQCLDDNGNKTAEFIISGRLDDKIVGMEIKAHGTNTGVKALASGEADIWMASAQVTDAQLAQLRNVGVERSGGNENIVGLDGVAIIVNPENPVNRLSKAQVKAIFTGKIKDWRDVGGVPGEINLYARDKESGTRKTFDEMILGPGVNLAPLVEKKPQGYDDSTKLSNEVAADPQGIGFVGMGFIKSAKVLAISDGGLTALTPTTFTVQKETYPLTRRLYLYTSKISSREALEFLSFVLSEKGQSFNSNSVTSLKPSVYWPPRDQADCKLSKNWLDDRNEFCRLLAHYGEISSSFAFDTASTQLDKLAKANILRVTDILRRMPDAEIILAGFADSRGTRSSNCALSLSRAKTVAIELENLGFSRIKARGFCDELPIRDDLGEDYERNRRVDVFVKK